VTEKEARRLTARVVKDFIFRRGKDEIRFEMMWGFDSARHWIVDYIDVLVTGLRRV
jgi:hypothetical protein